MLRGAARGAGLVGARSPARRIDCSHPVDAACDEPAALCDQRRSGSCAELSGRLQAAGVRWTPYGPRPAGGESVVRAERSSATTSVRVPATRAARSCQRFGASLETTSNGLPGRIVRRDVVRDAEPLREPDAVARVRGRGAGHAGGRRRATGALDASGQSTRVDKATLSVVAPRARATSASSPRRRSVTKPVGSDERRRGCPRSGLVGLLEREQVVDGLAPADDARLAVAHEHGRRAAASRCSSSSSRACSAGGRNREQVARRGEAGARRRRSARRPTRSGGPRR